MPGLGLAWLAFEMYVIHCLFMWIGRRPQLNGSLGLLLLGKMDAWHLR